MPTAKIISLVNSSLERQKELCWMPVISIGYSRSFDKEQVSVKLNRFWMAQHASDEYVACGWDVFDLDGQQQIQKVPASLMDKQGNVIVTYRAYSDELWNELNHLWMSLLQTFSCM